MIDFSLGTDEFGLLRCTLANGPEKAAATASNIPDALADLLGALDSASVRGIGECFWPRESGAFRWLLRREQEHGRLVVLWSIGTMTGWENVFSAECNWAQIESTIRDGVSRFQVQVGK
jgi:hypothetical protein